MDIKMIKDIVDAVRAAADPKTQAYDTPATVTRIENGTVWVHIPGGVNETPVRQTIAAKPGDTVQIRVGGGSAWLVGNATAPPTDDTAAKEAERKADEASGVAKNFVTDTKDGIFVHPKDNDKDGVRITDAIEIIKGGMSFIRAYVEGGIAKVRVGLTDAGHSVIDSNGMRVYAGDGSVQLADLGYTQISQQGETPYYVPYFTLGGRKSGTSIGEYSVAEGVDLEASGAYAHAEGTGCKASKTGSHAEGSGCEATAHYTHAEGRKAKATGLYAHAEGFETTASGEASHAGGDSCIAGGDGSFAHGIENYATYEAQTVFGKYASLPSSDDLLLIGNGSGESNRSNAMRLKADGRVEFAGAVGTGLSWDTRTAMINAVSVLPQNRPYMFAGGATWANTANAGSNAAFGIICRTSSTDWRLLFMAGANVYKSIFTWDGPGTTTGTFSTAQIG